MSGLFFAGGYTLGEFRLGGANKSELTLTTADDDSRHYADQAADTSMPGRSSSTVPWARAMFNFGGDGGDVTGSVAASKPKEPAKDAPKDTAKDAETGKAR